MKYIVGLLFYEGRFENLAEFESIELAMAGQKAAQSTHSMGNVIVVACPVSGVYSEYHDLLESLGLGAA